MTEMAYADEEIIDVDSKDAVDVESENLSDEEDGPAEYNALDEESGEIDDADTGSEAATADATADTTEDITEDVAADVTAEEDIVEEDSLPEEENESDAESLAPVSEVVLNEETIATEAAMATAAQPSEELNTTEAASTETPVAPATTTESKPKVATSTLTATKVGSTKIVRLSGGDEYSMAIKQARVLKSHLNVDKFSAIVLVNGDDYRNIVSGSMLAETENAPILLINDEYKDAVIDYIKKNLDPNGKVYIVGTKASISKSIEKQFGEYEVTRFGTRSKYTTNLRILKHINAGSKNEWAVISANGYKDSAAVMATGLPIMMVGKSLTSAQKKYLKSISRRDYTVVGTTKAVPKTVVKQLKKYGTVKRIVGGNRIETSIKVAEEFYPKNKKRAVMVSTGNLRKTLTSGSFASVLNSPVIYTAPSKAAYGYNYIVQKKIPKVNVVGDENLVSNSAVGGTAESGPVNISKYRYIVKSNGEMAQGEWIKYGFVSYKAADSGQIYKEKKPKEVIGIDVSQWQGKIDWEKVKASGIEFVFIRVGGRFYETGGIYADSMFETNIKGALKAGLKVGVYFFTQAITKKEALEEAKYTLKKIKNYKISLPVVIDTEINSSSNRLASITPAERTKCTKVFLEKVKKAGYTPMFYCGTYYMRSYLVAKDLKKYKMWLAQYYPKDKMVYDRDFTFWQYTSQGKVNGINGNVDMNIWYK